MGSSPGRYNRTALQKRINTPQDYRPFRLYRKPESPPEMVSHPNPNTSFLSIPGKTAQGNGKRWYLINNRPITQSTNQNKIKDNLPIKIKSKIKKESNKQDKSIYLPDFK